MKKIFVVMVLLCMMASVFTQEEKKGAIIGTFGVGVSVITAKTNTLFYTLKKTITWTALNFDLNVISKEGFALTFGDLVNFEIGTNITQNLYFGLGYHFLANKFSIGANLIASPDGEDCFIGGKLNGHYWITKSFGITATMIGGISVIYGTTLFNIQPGLSVRL